MGDLIRIDGQPFDRGQLLYAIENIRSNNRWGIPFTDEELETRRKKKSVKRKQDLRILTKLVEELNNVHTLTTEDLRFVKGILRSTSHCHSTKRAISKKLLPFKRTPGNTVKLHYKGPEPGTYLVKIVPRCQKEYYAEKLSAFRIWL